MKYEGRNCNVFRFAIVNKTWDAGRPRGLPTKRASHERSRIPESKLKGRVILFPSLSAELGILRVSGWGYYKWRRGLI
jgi:hypothetical protein